MLGKDENNVPREIWEEPTPDTATMGVFTLVALICPAPTLWSQAVHLPFIASHELPKQLRVDTLLDFPGPKFTLSLDIMLLSHSSLLELETVPIQAEVILPKATCGASFSSPSAA